MVTPCAHALTTEHHSMVKAQQDANHTSSSLFLWVLESPSLPHSLLHRVEGTEAEAL